MKTKTAVASLLLSLAFATSSCTGTDGSPASPPPDADPAAAKDAPPQGSASPAPPPSAPSPPPSSTTPPPAGSDAPPANAPEHPPALVGFWGSCDAYTFSTYLLREDGNAVSGISTRPKYGCGGGAPLPPAGEPDEECDCTWSVSGDGPSPSPKAPWRLFLSCEGESGSATIVRLDAETITFEGGDGYSYAYSRLDEPAQLAPRERRATGERAGRGEGTTLPFLSLRPLHHASRGDGPVGREGPHRDQANLARLTGRQGRLTGGFSQGNGPEEKKIKKRATDRRRGRGVGMFETTTTDRLTALFLPEVPRLIGLYRSRRGYTLVFEWFDGVRIAAVDSLGLVIPVPPAPGMSRPHQVS